ncbi:MAG: type III-A CRISPR-associated RAMP protein Csm3 [Magnetococcales bacterium]|nr:type III-A CRISPR-associated RAMP protein Csm3 [Magnetococcales bacterium]
MRLIQIRDLSGSIELLTGLHIGSGNTEMHIGGSDNPVIRHPHTNQPYIPGSSLKGKVRSLLEWWAGLVMLNDGKPMSYGKLEKAPDQAQAKAIIKLFGNAGSDMSKEEALDIGPTRVAFRDCLLNQDWVQHMKNKNLSLTEVKMENTIDRVRGVAEHPRNVERVPAGAVFQFQVAIKVLDAEDDLLDTLMIGLKLLEKDSLGGSGSRGYGRVKLTFTDEKIQDRFTNCKPW